MTVIYKNRAVCKFAQNDLLLTEFYGAICPLSLPAIPAPHINSCPRFNWKSLSCHLSRVLGGPGSEGPRCTPACWVDLRSPASVTACPSRGPGRALGSTWALRAAGVCRPAQ